MWVLGIVLLLGGAGCLWGAVCAQRRVRAMLAAETLSIAELEERRHTTAELGAAFRHVCEVVGQAHPAPGGPLTSELTGTACVWYSHRVQRHYKRYDRDSDGETRVTTGTETVAEHTAGHGFALLADGLTIGVDTGGRRPDGVEQVADRFEAAEVASGWVDVVGSLVGGDRDVTIGYQHTEWVLRAGTPLCVLGEVHDDAGPLIIAPPRDGGTFTVSTRSEEQLTAADRAQQRWLAWTGAGLAAAALPVLAIGLLG
jgi:hypothetical protein